MDAPIDCSHVTARADLIRLSILLFQCSFFEFHLVRCENKIFDLIFVHLRFFIVSFFPNPNLLITMQKQFNEN